MTKAQSGTSAVEQRRISATESPYVRQLLRKLRLELLGNLRGSLQQDLLRVEPGEEPDQLRV